MQNNRCTLSGKLVRSDHWRDPDNKYNFPLWQRKTCGAVGDVLTENEKKHYFTDLFCLSCPTKFGKSVLQLYEESELLEGFKEKSLYWFYTFLKPLLCNMEFDDADVGSEPTCLEKMRDSEKLGFNMIREAYPSRVNRIMNKILENIEANK